MRIVTSVVCSVIVVMAAVTLAAHNITFKGTALEAGKTSVRVNVVDAKTKKVAPMVFVVDQETKVLRDDVVVKFAEAKIQKGEPISVTVDHDLDEELAQVIRLGKTK
jgi:hypothetical protein